MRQREAAQDRAATNAARELDQTREALSAAESSLADAVAARASLDLAAKQASADFDTATTALSAARADVSRLEDELAARPERAYDDAVVDKLRDDYEALAEAHAAATDELGELRALEEQLSKELDEAHGKARSLEDDKASLVLGHADDLEKEQGAAFSARQRVAELQRALDEAKRVGKTYEMRVEALTTELGTLRSESSALHDRRQSEAFALATSQRRASDLNERVAHLEERLELAREDHAEFAAAAAAELTRLRADLADAQRKHADSQTEVVHLEARVAAVTSERDVLARAPSPPPTGPDAEALVTRLRTERDAATAQLGHLQIENATMRGLATTKSDQLRDAQLRIDELTTRLDSARTANADLERRADAAATDLAAVRRERDASVRDLEDYMAELQAELDLRRAAHAKQGDVEDRLAVALAEVAQLRANLEEQDAAIESLEEERAAAQRATLKALADVERLRRPALPAAFAERDEVEALAARVERRNHQIAALQAENARLVTNLELVAAADTSAGNATCLSVETDEPSELPGLLVALLDLRRQLRRAVAQAGVDVAAATTRIAALEAELAAARHSPPPPEYEADSHQERLAAALLAHITTERALAAQTARATTLETELGEARIAHAAALERARADEATSRAATEGAEHRICELCDELGRVRDAAERVENASAEARASLQTNLDAARADCESLTRRLDAAESAAAAHEREATRLRGEEDGTRTRLTAEIKTLRSLVKQKDETLAGFQDKVDEATAEIVSDFNRLSEEYNRLSAELDERDETRGADATQHAEELEYAREEIGRLAEQLGEARNRAEELEGQLAAVQAGAEDADDRLHDALRAKTKLSAANEKLKVRVEALLRDANRTPSTAGTKRALPFEDKVRREADVVVAPAPAVAPAAPMPSPPAAKPLLAGTGAGISFKPKRTIRAPLAPLAQAPADAASLQARLNTLGGRARV